jgi:predicted ATPase with chaperone activity
VGELSLEGRTRPAKGALVIAAAGAHNLLMLGPPGSGKTVYISQHRSVDPAAVDGEKRHVREKNRIIQGEAQPDHAFTWTRKPKLKPTKQPRRRLWKSTCLLIVDKHRRRW